MVVHVRVTDDVHQVLILLIAALVPLWCDRLAMDILGSTEG